MTHTQIGETRNQSKYCKIKKFLYKRIPITGWLPQYSWVKLLQDTLAGTTVGLTAIPQGIAYAVVAGLPPHYGLYSSFMGCFIYIIFGSTKEVTVGPTAIMGLLTRPFVLNYGNDFAVLLCFLTGCLITTMGLLFLGLLVDFISMPVICGFTNAAAIIIGSSQINILLGISGCNESFYDTVNKLIQNFKEIQLWDTILGVCSTVILVGLKNFPGSKRGTILQKCIWIVCLSRNAVVVIAGMVLTYFLSIYGYNPFKIIGTINEGLPTFDLPPFSTSHNDYAYTFVDMINILGSAIISVPLVALLESIAIAKAFAKGKILDANQEMIAVGLCNLFGSFVHSMPITGSFTRTAINNASGVETPMSGFVTGCIVLIVCGFLTKLFRFIPKSILASVIIVAMYYMFEIRIFQILWKIKKLDLLLLLVTFASCLTFGLEIGMIIGITTNIIILLRDTARPGLIIEERRVNEKLILFVLPQQSLSFPSAEYLRQQIMSWCNILKDISIIIIDGSNVSSIDATVAKHLSLLLSDLELRKKKLIFWNWCTDAHKTLVGFYAAGEKNFKSSHNILQIINDEMSMSEESARNE